MKKLILAVLVTLFMLSSCQTAKQDNVPKESETEFDSTQIERAKNEIIYHNGASIDLTNISTICYGESDRAAYYETFEELDTNYKKGRIASHRFIIKVTVTGHAESVTPGNDKFKGLCCSYVPCYIESIIYQGEKPNLYEGQQLNVRTSYYAFDLNGESYFEITPGTMVLRRGYSYIIYGTYHDEAGYYMDDEQGCFEISSDAEKSTFAENIGLNYPLKSSFQDEVFEKYSNVLTESELAIVKKDNTVVE